MQEIKDFHIHLYYDESTINIAKEVGLKAQSEFDISIGRFHEKNVGPHPRWSVQLSIPTDKFGEILAWVSLNRKGLTIFSHPNTGDDLLDHTEHSIWMGELLELNTKIFSKD
ncbi:4,5-dioxygenase [Halobacteriovorax marinus]|uniref:4,5-dioxygenase n=1 Tax=Halobacteriovorax marinus TaxID=97084 RepID=A0A1Y5F289_9BACT|nr:4,5-dioxygenase [Halobacteriovorax marinus]